jgi:CRP-like cAMP-binding protein
MSSGSCVAFTGVYRFINRIRSSRRARMYSGTPFTATRCASVSRHEERRIGFLSQNALLAGLADDVLAQSREHMHMRELKRGEVLYSGLSVEDIKFVYFPLTAVMSMVTVLADGDCVEALPVGFEGLAGFQVIFGSSRMLEQWVCAVPGFVVEMRVDRFWDLLNANAQLGRILLCYSQSLITALAVSVACNARHSVTERCAKWILLTHDRIPSDDFPMTHEHLASLLGVRRAGISEVAGDLQRGGGIRYSRGLIEVIDRSALERVGCECYGNVTREYQRLMTLTRSAEFGLAPVDERS